MTWVVSFLLGGFRSIQLAPGQGRVQGIPHFCSGKYGTPSKIAITCKIVIRTS